MGNIKIQEISDFVSAQAQVTQYLSPVYWKYGLDSFDFHHDEISDQYIYTICVFDD
jgi:hypothetical protein